MAGGEKWQGGKVEVIQKMLAILMWWRVIKMPRRAVYSIKFVVQNGVGFDFGDFEKTFSEGAEAPAHITQSEITHERIFKFTSQSGIAARRHFRCTGEDGGMAK